MFFERTNGKFQWERFGNLALELAAVDLIEEGLLKYE